MNGLESFDGKLPLKAFKRRLARGIPQFGGEVRVCLNEFAEWMYTEIRLSRRSWETYEGARFTCC